MASNYHKKNLQGDIFSSALYIAICIQSDYLWSLKTMKYVAVWPSTSADWLKMAQVPFAHLELELPSHLATDCSINYNGKRACETLRYMLEFSDVVLRGSTSPCPRPHILKILVEYSTLVWGSKDLIVHLYSFRLSSAQKLKKISY